MAIEEEEFYLSKTQILNNSELIESLRDAIVVVEKQVEELETQIELYHTYNEGHEKILEDLFGGSYASSIEEQMEDATGLGGDI